MKRILVINTVPYSVGGISTVVKNYYEAVDHNKIHMDFVVNDFIAPMYKELFEKRGSRLYYVRRNSIIRYILAIRNILRTSHYDVVHIHGNSRTMTLDMMAAWLGKCHCRVVHSHNTTTSHPILHALLKLPFDCLCTGRLACSDAAGRWLFGNKAFQVLHNAINMSSYKYDSSTRNRLRLQLGLKADDFVIGHVGYFNEQKNQSFIIDILEYLRSQVSSIYVMFIGAGPLMSEIKEKVRQKGFEKEVFFLGESDKVADWMSVMDLFLFPSKWEGLGIAMLEAQMMGLPCIASSEVPLETDIIEGNIRLSLSDSISVWGNSCLRIIRDEKKRNREQILVTSDAYEIEKQVQFLEQYYESLT